MTDETKLMEPLAKLRAALRYGDKKAICDRLGMPRSSVDAVLKGEYEDDRVVDAALEIVKQRAAATRDRASKILEALGETRL